MEPVSLHIPDIVQVGAEALKRSLESQDTLEETAFFSEHPDYTPV